MAAVAARPSSRPLPDRALGPLLLASAPLLWALFLAFASTNRTLEQRPRELLLFFAAFALFLICTLAVWRANPLASRRWTLLILATGLLFRLTVAPLRPATTTDVYRYLWEARVTRAGYNPYTYPPNAPELTPLRNWMWNPLPFKSVPAAYPPVAQYVFLLSSYLPLPSVRALKLLLALFDVLTLLLLADLLRRLGRPPAWVIAYAWHPLIVCELVARGHLDTIGLFFLVLTFRLRLLRPLAGPILSGAALALSILSKGYALVVTPFLLPAPGRRLPFLLGLAAAAFLAYLPFLSAGPDLFRGLSLYARQWVGNSSVFALTNLALSPLTDRHDTLARLLCTTALAAWIIWLYLTRRAPADDTQTAARFSFRSLAGLILLTPAVYPWYLGWTIPFLCLERSLPWLLLTGTIFGFYAHNLLGPGHTEIWLITTAEYALPALVAVAMWLARAARGER
jgi:alpha-1,6-mannosyltransferase